MQFRTTTTVLCTILSVTLVLCAARASAQHRDYTMRFDVVELVNGNRVEGSEQFSDTHGKYTYLFASEDNLKTFCAARKQYEIQLGGACARMGPLSGEATTRLPTAHDGRVYLFASEACRTTFLQEPERFLFIRDAAPEPTDEQTKCGRRMLGRAVDAVACHAQIDAISTYREVLSREEESGGVLYTVTQSLTLHRPGSVRWDVCWNEMCWGYISHDGNAWTTDSRGVRDLNGQQRDELVQNAGRHPFRYLWARDSKDLIMSADGSTRTVSTPKDGEIELELVTVHMDGATSTLGLDDAGRIRLMTYRGRGPDSTIGEIERQYSAFHRLNGLLVPGRVDTTFNGEVVTKWSGDYAIQTIDAPADVTQFERIDPAQDANTADESGA